jgi:hypothetical protein
MEVKLPRGLFFGSAGALVLSFAEGRLNSNEGILNFGSSSAGFELDG